MAENIIRFNINLRTSVQGRNSRSNLPTADMQEIEKKTFDAITYAITDIAFKAAKNQQKNVQRQLESKVTAIIRGELRNMGRKIASQAIGLGPGARWPSGGTLSLDGDLSTAFRALNPQAGNPMSIKAVTGQWRARTDDYLRRKAKKFGHRKWWLNTGDLRKAVQAPELWTGAYGPVRVAWIPENIQRGYTGGGSSRYSTFARGVGRSLTVTSGRIEMKVLGRITTDMLAGPGEPSKDSRYTGLLDMLPENIEKKLRSRGDPYRPIIEPFLTYYLNRQIPNRIWRTLETSIKPLA